MSEWKLIRTESEGAEAIAMERNRQIEVEGWHAGHDATHDDGDLARAALCYIEHAIGSGSLLSVPAKWPWGEKWWKPTGPVRDLEKAGALIAAEIDKRKRKEAKA